MIIAVEYRNGRIKEYDASGFVPTEASRGRSGASRNVVTEYDLRLDRIADDGLVLDIYWHDQELPGAGSRPVEDAIDEHGKAVALPRAPRRAGVTVTIVNQEVLEEVARIIVWRANGSVQAAWRQGKGNWLVNGAMFEAQRVLTYTDAQTTSLNGQATFVHDYLANAHPELDEGEITAMMGYPLEAYQEIVGEEGSQQGGMVISPADDPDEAADAAAGDAADAPTDPYGDSVEAAGDDAWADEDEG